MTSGIDKPLTDEEVRRLVDIAKIELELYKQHGDHFEKYCTTLIAELEKELQLQYNVTGSTENLLTSEKVENLRDVLIRRGFENQYFAAVAAERQRIVELENQQRKPILNPVAKAGSVTAKPCGCVRSYSLCSR